MSLHSPSSGSRDGIAATAVEPVTADGDDTIPFYRPIRDEVELFLAAYRARLPVLLKGPTGCGKTRFVEAMAQRLYRGDLASEGRLEVAEPLLTIACHEDLTATDLVGRYLLRGDETVWIDGPLTRSVRQGSICYLDEIVEARKDTTVLIHALTDHRRLLPVEKRSEMLTAHPDFLLVLSYNPGYQSVLKDLKTSTRQRFVAIEFDYPPADAEAEIIAHEADIDAPMAESLARLGERIRALHRSGFEDGVSTRLLIYAGQLIAGGIDPVRACETAIAQSVTDQPDVQQAIVDLVETLL
ncbi:MAG: CbbQ/NirQ/NorQ/GpvN family protein [Acidobacteria bacterium]|nr:MAG: CbbQ/NirQ/NorQ/GpvN family protein [Acidobacteriota bacterium]REK00306.1 MAG: CbbQ/NirQ/NorQ/GpvN family protein [Acidobacteriota bacterium]